MSSAAIRPETERDRDGIRAIHTAAFAGPAEAGLVDGLRREGVLLHSLVAELGTAMVGHVVFARGWVGQDTPVVTVGPVGVLPDHQRVGVGSAMMRMGIDCCRDDGEAALFLLGDPCYYSRFGFSVAAAAPYVSPYAGPHFQMLELRPGALPPQGTVQFPRAFAQLD